MSAKEPSLTVRYNDHIFACIDQEKTADTSDQGAFSQLLSSTEHTTVVYGDCIEMVFPTSIGSAVLYDCILNEDGSSLYKMVTSKEIDVSTAKGIEYKVEEHPAMFLSSKFPNPYEESPRGIKVEYTTGDTTFCQYYIFVPQQVQ